MKKVSIIFMIAVFNVCVFSQTNGRVRPHVNEQSTIWLRPNNDGKEFVPKKTLQGEFVFENVQINDFFKRHKLTDFSLAFPAIKNIPELNRRGLDKVYQITCDCNVSTLADSIKRLLSNYYSDIEIAPVYEPLYTPNDFAILDPIYGPNWQLNLIEAKKAWDITKGSASVPIAIIEVPSASGSINNYDLNHEDLQSNIIYYNDGTQTQHPHGTFVAGCASAVTDNNLGLSSIGFNSSLMLYRGTHSNNWIDAVNRGARVISLSFISCSFSSHTNNVVNMLTDLGVVILAGAGNGIYPLDHPQNPGQNRASCGTNGNGYGYPASYDNVISVSSVGEDNKHWFATDGSGSRHTHNDKVDICAPGYRVLSTFPNNNYGRSSGTSFSTPITAGLVALMLSIAPSQELTGVRYLLAQSSDVIADESNFPGMLGAGRINAFKALKMTGTRNIYDTTLTGNQILSAGYGFNVANSSVGANSNISLKARIEVKIESSFSVPWEAVLKS
jgi:hypothetical protein